MIRITLVIIILSFLSSCAKDLGTFKESQKSVHGKSAHGRLVADPIIEAEVTDIQINTILSGIYYEVTVVFDAGLVLSSQTQTKSSLVFMLSPDEATEIEVGDRVKINTRIFIE